MSLRNKSYEVLPALSVRGSELRQSLRIVTVAWMFGIVWMSCIMGSHVKSFARILGFNDLAFGIMAAMPFLGACGHIVGAILVERSGLRKQFFIATQTIARLAWLGIALIPILVPIPSSWGVTVMLVILWASWFLAGAGTTAWFNWMGDLIPRRIRGRYMANRARLCRCVQIVAVIALGLIVDAVTVSDAPETAEGQPTLLWVTSVIFVVAAVFGAIDILLFRRIREIVPSVGDAPRKAAVDIRVAPPRSGNPASVLAYWARYTAAAVRQILIEPMRDAGFSRYVISGAAIIFSMAASGWYVWIYALEHLGFSKLGTNALFLVIAPLMGIASARMWGKLIDKWGRRPVLILATLGISLTLLPWFFATRDTPHPQFIAASVNWVSRGASGLLGKEIALVGASTPLGAYLLGVLACVGGGICWTGLLLGQSGVMLGFSESAGRSKYVAASSVLIGMGGVVGGLAGGVVAQSLQFLQDNPIGPFGWNNLHATFALAILARIVGLGAVVNMPDPGARRVRDVVRYMYEGLYNVVIPRLPFRHRYRLAGGSLSRRVR
ncbi:MAG: MFS transporter, partial [Planctomycetota bacterium]